MENLIYLFLYRQSCYPPDQTINIIIYRSGSKKVKESETNTIDRAIANLMFNKLDFNVQDLPLAALSSSENKITRSMELPDCKPYKSHLAAPPKDAEVPVMAGKINTQW